MKSKINKLAHIEKGCKIGKNVVIHGSANILKNSTIEDGVEIFGETYIINSVIKRNSVVFSSVIENSEVGENNKIGPFAHLRPNTKTENSVKIGSFVETKNSVLGEGTKAAHLAYVGDADIGKNVNIGCGVVFVNYDGKNKHRSKVGDDAFVGSNCNIIAPIEIQEKTYICAGTTVTENTNKEDFVIGRTKPTVKPKRAGKYLKEK